MKNISSAKLSSILESLDSDMTSNGYGSGFKAYYDTHRKEYLIKNEHAWIPQTAAQFKRRLRSEGLSTKSIAGMLISPAEAEMLHIEDHHSVEYTGALAGYQEGFYDNGELRFLVTRSSNLINPKEGNWDVLKHTIDAVLGDDGHNQQHFMYGWLKVAVTALRKGEFVPGQAMAIAGAAGCGKSLIQNLITVFFGGRSAKPYQYMTGGTTFNSELFQAEHLMIEDEAPSSDYKSRRKLGTNIKGFTVNETQRLHAKGRDAVTVRVFWRLSITLNDEPEDLHVLPPIDQSLEDKIILLRAYKRDLPMPTNNQEQRRAYWDALIAAIPGFLHWLLNDFTIPEELLSERFGITHFHHPALIQSLTETSNESEFLTLIDLYIKLPFMGTASELDAGLREMAPRQAGTLLYFNGAAGAYLARLSKLHPSRIQKRRTCTKNQWHIFPETEVENNE